MAKSHVVLRQFHIQWYLIWFFLWIVAIPPNSFSPQYIVFEMVHEKILNEINRELMSLVDENPSLAVIAIWVGGIQPSGAQLSFSTKMVTKIAT